MRQESEGPGAIPGMGTANQAVRPYGLGKLVAFSEQWVTTSEDWNVVCGP